MSAISGFAMPRRAAGRTGSPAKSSTRPAKARGEELAASPRALPMLSGIQIELAAVIHPALLALFDWINQPALVRFSAPYRPVHERSHGDWFDAVSRDPSRVIFAIRSKREGELLGTVQLTDIHPIYRQAQMLIRIGDPRHHGRGIGTEALRLLLDFAWRDLNLHRVWAQVFARNQRPLAWYPHAQVPHEGTRQEC